MKKIALMLAAFSFAALSHAALKPGDSLSPYQIKNVSTGKQYCQVCAYGAKSGKIVSFGKLKDEAFWTDLKKLQAIADKNPKLGVFAQVIDSKNAKAIQATADKHGITFPVVVAVEKDWDKAYDVKGVSRTIYYARQKNNIVWTATGLDDKAASELESQVAKDIAG
jgi:hypothetical protein